MSADVFPVVDVVDDGVDFGMWLHWILGNQSGRHDFLVILRVYVSIEDRRVFYLVLANRVLRLITVVDIDLARAIARKGFECGVILPCGFIQSLVLFLGKPSQ